MIIWPRQQCSGYADSQGAAGPCGDNNASGYITARCGWLGRHSSSPPVISMFVSCTMALCIVIVIAIIIINSFVAMVAIFNLVVSVD